MRVNLTLHFVPRNHPATGRTLTSSLSRRKFPPLEHRTLVAKQG
eukprot:SAG31_NODE_1423_length_8400_cov_2.665944_3_plen_44_part_00